MNSTGVDRLTLSPLTGRWFRAILPDYWSEVTETRYTRSVPSRFSPGANGTPPFEILYFGESAEVIAIERSLIFFDRWMNHAFPNPEAGSHLFVASQVVLQRIADLTAPDNLAILETNVQELTGDWTIYSNAAKEAKERRPHLASVGKVAPTQELGQRLFAVPGLEAIRVFSARKPECLCLVVFPQKLLQGSSITFLNDPKASKRIRGTKRGTFGGIKKRSK